MPELTEWESFYVIVGSSAGALVGLQFVVLTLIADRPPAVQPEQAGAAFATPTIVHFSTVLLLSAALSAPWHGIGGVAALWGLVAVAGAIYTLIVARRMKTQAAYQPAFEDWCFHAMLPLAAYATLAGSALAACSHLREALFGTAAGALLLLFIGIHNAWDAVVYHVLVNQRPRED